MIKILIIGLGGAAGSVLRYGTSVLMQRMFSKALFPLGTLTVNILGCFLIGYLAGLSENRQLFSPELRMFVFIGFLGGFTTFSTFGLEIFKFARDGQMFTAGLNFLLHVIIGFGGVWLGFSLSK